MTVRTNIEIDRELIDSVLAETGLRTKREAVHEALKTLLQLKRQERVNEYRGKLRWEGDLDELRADRTFGE